MTEYFPSTVARCGKNLDIRNEVGAITETIACSLPPHGPISHHRYESTPFEDLPVPPALLQAPGLVYLGTDGTQTILDRYDWTADHFGVRGTRESAILTALLTHVLNQVGATR